MVKDIDALDELHPKAVIYAVYVPSQLYTETFYLTKCCSSSQDIQLEGY